MKKIILFFFLLLSLHSFAQEEIKLYPNGVKEGNFAPRTESYRNPGFLVDVSEPRLYYYPAQNAQKGTTPAILIIPGGGYEGLSIGAAGNNVAEYFSQIGIASFVLYYRMPFHHANVPLEDAKKAMEIIRGNAKKWNIDKKKVGVIGFSAGGHLAATLETHYEKANKPNFVAVIYPVISFLPQFEPKGTCKNLLGDNPSQEQIDYYSNELHVTDKTPPTFIAHAMDDSVVTYKQSVAFADALKQKGVKYKLKLYKKGGHSFGMKRQHTDSDFWYASFREWLNEIHILKPSKISTEGYKLVWEDDFKGNELDTTVWTNEPAKPGWVNHELQRYTDGENVTVKDGILTLTARYENSEYTSARLITRDKKTFTYGIMEIKAKLPKGVGTWPAIWMLGNNIKQVGWPACGELDIMEEVGKNPDFIHTSIHNSSGYGATPYTGIVEINDPFDTWHIYGMKWTKDYIDFYVDGQLSYHYQPAEKNAKNWPFDKPAYFILNIAVGGDWGGPNVDNSIFPARMEIDWIKVYQQK